MWGWSQEHGLPLVLTRALSLVVGPSAGWGPRCDRRQRGGRCAHGPPWAGAHVGDKRAQWPVRGPCRARGVQRKAWHIAAQTLGSGSALVSLAGGVVHGEQSVGEDPHL